MLPYLKLWDYNISMYGIACLIGIILAAFVSVRQARLSGISREDTFYALLFALIGLLIGAKILYIVTVLPKLWQARTYIAENPKSLLLLFTGGFVFYGGITGGVLGVFVYCRRYCLPFCGILDTLAPGVPLAQAFGRIGCFFAGCCYGKEYHGLFAVEFPEGSASPYGISLFPIQPAESVINIFIFLTLLIVSRKKKESGFIFSLYALLYAIFRFILEFFRGDTERGIMINLSTSQWISILIIPAVFLFRKQCTKRRGN